MMNMSINVNGVIVGISFEDNNKIINPTVFFDMEELKNILSRCELISIEKDALITDLKESDIITSNKFAVMFAKHMIYLAATEVANFYTKIYKNGIVNSIEKFESVEVYEKIVKIYSNLLREFNK